MSSLPLIVKYIIVAFVSMVPIVELRGAIPIAEGLGLNIFLYYPIAIIFNMLPVPIIYLFARKVLEWGNEKITSSYTYIIEHFIKQNRINKYKKIWSNYKDKGRLINFFHFNEEDKSIKDKSWYNNI